MSRRSFLQGCSAAVLAVPLVAGSTGLALAQPAGPFVPVRPRSDWAQGVSGPVALEQEAAGDVRFLLVHHSASSNDYGPDEVPRIIRGFHAFHTGPEKGWPDVAYNFFVDRYGGVWEGRSGSLAGPVKPDATGGSQGFAQICCFIGDHTAEPPTPEAQRSMIALLAELAGRYGVDPAPGTTASFVSRGSNRWPAGATVTTTTIAGHRDMSLTSCPGDAAYPMVRDVFPVEAAALLAARTAPPAAEPSAPVPPPPTEPASSAAPSGAAGTEVRGTEPVDDGVEPVIVAVVGAAAVAAAGTATLVGRARRGTKADGEGERSIP